MKTAVCLECGIVIAILTTMEFAKHTAPDGAEHTKTVVRDFVPGDVVGQPPGAVPGLEVP